MERVIFSIRGGGGGGVLREGEVVQGSRGEGTVKGL